MKAKSPIQLAKEKLEAHREEITDLELLSGAASVGSGAFCPFTPAPEIVIVKREEAREKLGVLSLPTKVAEKSRPMMGKVLAVGKSCHWTIPVGTTILFYEFGMTPFFFQGKEYVAVKMMDVICSVNETPDTEGS
jgi:co-chaperonin GroES (HSP10)